MSNAADRLKKRISNLPLGPGVYLFKDKDGEYLYIGKARELKKRVGSYFQSRVQSPKIEILLSRVDEIEIVETQTEVDALLLEADLIKTHQPRYNTAQKDDKSFPLLKLTGDAFPRLLVTRNRKDAKAVYYGPYTDARLLREAVRVMNGIFPIRKCRTLPKRACLYYHIGQCLAPCIKPEVKPRYDWLVKQVKGFLGGGRKSLIDYITEKMREAAGEYRFEDAQFFKEQIEALGWFRKKRFDLKRPEGGIGLAGTLELKRTLHLARLPEKIVCFDVSNIYGEEAVASKVCFCRELAHKLEYRRYRIKTVTGINDYAMIQEALRRMVRGVQEGRESAMPDLVMIDGGKGHLNAARRILQEEECPDVSILAIAKRLELVYVPDTQGPIVFPAQSAALRLLEKIRDEAHRFAISYHRTLKQKKLTRSLLDEIEGIGEKRRKILHQSFASLEELSQTPLDVLARLPGMDRAAAEKVLHFLREAAP